MKKRGPRPVNENSLRVFYDMWERTFRGMYKGVAAKESMVLPKFKSPAEPKYSRDPEVARQQFAAFQRNLKREEDKFLARGLDTIDVELEGIPSERPLWDKLMAAKSARQVRSVCKASPRWLNPKW